MLNHQLKDAQNIKALQKNDKYESVPQKVCIADTTSAQKFHVELEIDD
jgi:hypothetical protein